MKLRPRCGYITNFGPCAEPKGHLGDHRVRGRGHTIWQNEARVAGRNTERDDAVAWLWHQLDRPTAEQFTAQFPDLDAALSAEYRI